MVVRQWRGPSGGHRRTCRRGKNCRTWRLCAGISHTMQLDISAGRCARFSHSGEMPPVATKLKNLRKAANPRLTVRAMAEALEMPFGSYSFYESASTFKKPFLPLEFARKVAVVLGRHGVDAAEVMKLAGLTGDEAKPEARAIEALAPPIQFVSMTVALPNELLLQDMFRGLLASVPETATIDEAAAILARRLATGLAGIGHQPSGPASVGSTAVDGTPQSPASAPRGA